MNIVCYLKVKVAQEILRLNSSGLTSKTTASIFCILEISSIETFVFFCQIFKNCLIIYNDTVYSLYCNVMITNGVLSS